MTHKVFKSLFTALLILMTFCINAQDGFFVEAKCTNEYPGIGEQIKLTYDLKLEMSGGSASVSHNGIQVIKPNLKDFNVLQEGKGNSFSFGGFGSSAMKVGNYTFIIQPTKKGKFTIGPLTFIMNGNEYKSKSITINVGEGDPKAKIIPKNSNYFVRIDANKNSLYLGEHALVTYTLYSRYSNISIKDYEFPMAPKLWKEDLNPKDGSWPQRQEVINGVAYLVVPLKKEIVYPQTTGEVEIPKIGVDLMVGGGFFSQGSMEKLQSNSLKLNVKSLPKNAPISFSNQVGKSYDLEMSYSKNELKSGEAIDIKIKISGKGNLKQMEIPQLNLPSDFEQFEPEVNDNIKLSSSGLSGSKEFSYLVIPRHHGIFDIPEFEYSYFDLSSKKYETLTFPSQTINVAKGENEENFTTNSSNGTNQEEVELVSNEIRHIASDTNLKSNSSSFFKSGIFWTGLFAPFLLFLGAFGYSKKQPKSIDETKVAQKNASKKLFKVLNLADQKLKQQDDKGFYEELYKGITSYFSNKFSVPISEITKAKIAETLKTKGINESVVKDFENILTDCEMARFAPTNIAGAQSAMDKAKSIIENIEKSVK